MGDLYTNFTRASGVGYAERSRRSGSVAGAERSSSRESRPGEVTVVPFGRHLGRGYFSCGHREACRLQLSVGGGHLARALGFSVPATQPRFCSYLLFLGQSCLVSSSAFSCHLGEWVASLLTRRSDRHRSRPSSHHIAGASTSPSLTRPCWHLPHSDPFLVAVGRSPPSC